MNIQTYLDAIRATYATGVATEHSYRPALLALFQSIDPALIVVNEPKQVAVGAPDFVFRRGDTTIGWGEAKDIDKDVVKLKDYSKEQKERYRRAFPNLLYTNGLDFEFLRDGERLAYVTIADLGFGLPARPERFAEFEHLLIDFATQAPISITSAPQLAKLMAAKAAIIKDVLGNVLAEDRDLHSQLAGQYKAFRKDLLPHLEPGEFADIYAETITYGMFAARLHDTTLDSFSRQEALELLPRSNPFLRSLFGYIAGPELDERIAPWVNDLAQVLRASDPSLLFKDFGRFTARNDPFVHFYEDFLKEYNPAKRKSRGVWYTPEPVVDFIVRAVDDVLRTEFGLADGLADTGKVMVDWDTGATNPKTGKPLTEKREVHRVQILDPATGTGTFLAKAVQLIAARVKARAPGKWSGYVEEDLIPRLHGFELLMASYAMCHLKLDMQLRETGYRPSAKPPRLSVWLTNALEPGSVQQQSSFFTALSDEAHGAGEVKRNHPIMCVIGNPPYSGHSQNKGAWIEGLMQAYKVSPELKRPAQAKWLSDDYVKFIRMAEEVVSRNVGGGVVAFITNHAYLDNPTFLDMRRHLMNTFDAIHIFDLHGNSKRKEVAPDGSADKNVFDIQQGVAIMIGVRRAKPSDGCRITHHDLWGSRETKYDWLWSNPVPAIGDDLTPTTAPWRWKPTDADLAQRYGDGFSVAGLFSSNGRPAPGIVTTQDEFAISWSRQDQIDKIEWLLCTPNEQAARAKMRLCSQSQWSYGAAKTALRTGEWKSALTKIDYRPFDVRWTVFDSNVAVHRRMRVSRHFIETENLALQVSRQRKSPGDYTNFLVNDRIAESSFLSNKTSEISSVLPLSHPR